MERLQRENQQLRSAVTSLTAETQRLVTYVRKHQDSRETDDDRRVELLENQLAELREERRNEGAYASEDLALARADVARLRRELDEAHGRQAATVTQAALRERILSRRAPHVAESMCAEQQRTAARSLLTWLQTTQRQRAHRAFYRWKQATQTEVLLDWVVPLLREAEAASGRVLVRNPDEATRAGAPPMAMVPGDAARRIEELEGLVSAGARDVADRDEQLAVLGELAKQRKEQATELAAELRKTKGQLRELESSAAAPRTPSARTPRTPRAATPRTPRTPKTPRATPKAPPPKDTPTTTQRLLGQNAALQREVAELKEELRTSGMQATNLAVAARVARGQRAAEAKRQRAEKAHAEAQAALRKDLARARGDVERARDKQGAAERAAAAARAEAAASAQQLERAREQLQAASQQRREAMAAVAELKQRGQLEPPEAPELAEVEVLRSERDTARAEVVVVQSEVAGLRRELERARKASVTSSASSSVEVEGLRRQLAESQAEATDLRRELAERQAEAADLRRQLADRSSQQSTSDEATDLRRQLADSQREVERLKKKRSAQPQDETDQLRRELRETRDKLRAATRSASVTSVEAIDDSATVRALKDKVRTLADRAAVAEDRAQFGSTLMSLREPALENDMLKTAVNAVHLVAMLKRRAYIRANPGERLDGVLEAGGAAAPPSPPPPRTTGPAAAKRGAKRHVAMFAQDVDEGEALSFTNVVVEKEQGTRQLLAGVLRHNFLFQNLGSEERADCVDAMFSEECKQGVAIMHQGDEGKHFYVLERGGFDVLVDGAKVAAIEPGSGFGDLALMQNAPRAATLVATRDSLVWALDRRVFRRIVAQGQAKKLEGNKEALRKVKLLTALTEEQMERVAQAVQEVKFHANSKIIVKGEHGDTFFILKSGTCKVTDIPASASGAPIPDIVLKEGAYFGERALLKDEPRAANVVATTNAVCLTLDRGAFTELLGPLQQVIGHNLVGGVLRHVPLFRRLSREEHSAVVDGFIAQLYEDGTVIARAGETDPVFRVVREGEAAFGDDTDGERKTLEAGDYFGDLFGQEPAPHTVVAQGLVEVFELSRATAETLLRVPLPEIMEREEVELEAEEAKDEGLPQLPLRGAHIRFEDLEVVRTLGTGAFGRVKLVQHRETRDIYALKILQKAQVVEMKQQTNVINEKQILAALDHPFILRLEQTFKDADCLYMLLECVQGGELCGVLDRFGGKLASDAARFYAGSVALAFQHLAAKKIVYRDLKPENLLIDSGGFVRVVDFGFGKVVRGRTHTLCGTPEYLAPEIVLGLGHNQAVDYWTLGILIYDMLHGYTPFADRKHFDQVTTCRKIVKGKLKFSSKVRDADAKDLCTKLLATDPVKRLGMLKRGVQDILDHPWFADHIDLAALLAREVDPPFVPRVADPLDTSNFPTYDEDVTVAEYSGEELWDEHF